MDLFIVGKWISEASDGQVWEFQGVYSSTEAAVSACKSSLYFVAPAVLDREIGDATEAWPDAFYPISP